MEPKWSNVHWKRKTHQNKKYSQCTLNTMENQMVNTRSPFSTWNQISTLVICAIYTTTQCVQKSEKCQLNRKRTSTIIVICDIYNIIPSVVHYKRSNHSLFALSMFNEAMDNVDKSCTGYLYDHPLYKQYGKITKFCLPFIWLNSLLTTQMQNPLAS